MAALFLGLDLSTQALKASLLSHDLSVLSELEVRFDRDLPQFRTKGGTLLGPPRSGIVYSPVMMVVEAMDMLFERIKEAKWPVQNIRGVSAAGQQHASVYWSNQAKSLLANMKSNASMASQLNGAFSRQEIPNWQDSSTLSECSQLEQQMNGPSNLANRTGSRAHTRFTGPQIMRFIATETEAYEKTARISLVSSTITTLLCLDGEIKGIDESDACGMNMWNMNTSDRGWDQEVLMIIGGGKEGAKALEEKLGRVESDGGRVVGFIGRWFVERYSFSPECIVCPGTGDNPATFLSFTLGQGEGLLSLGTSDTVLLSTSTFQHDPEFHAFFHPAQIVEPTKQEKMLVNDSARNNAGKGGKMKYFNMLVYKSGSLAREHVRDEYFGSSWGKFNEAVEASRRKHADDVPTKTGFWWLKPEIIPSNAFGVHKYVHSGKDIAEKVDDFASPSSNAIAILESQMLNYRSRASTILGSDMKRVFATGGAASNSTICSVMADVFGCKVCKPATYNGGKGDEEGKWEIAHWNACSVAAGYKAAWSWHRHTADEESSDKNGKWISFDDFYAQCREERRKARVRKGGEGGRSGGLEMLEEGVAIVARPDGQRSKAYSNSVESWKVLEARALRESQAMASK